MESKNKSQKSEWGGEASNNAGKSPEGFAREISKRGKGTGLPTDQTKELRPER